MRFAMPKQAPAGLWRRVPPAIFPPLLGLGGIALAWRGAVLDAGVLKPFSDALSGAVVALTLFAVLAYGSKLLRRPTMLREELAILPGRAGVGAGVLCLYVLAGLIAPFGLSAARGLLLVTFALHLGFWAVLIPVLLNGPADQRRVTPVWQLNFVGPIVGARVALLVGWPALAQALFWPCLLAAVLIWGASYLQWRRERVPAPLRPLLAIHLAPVALHGTVATGLGWGGAGWWAALLALAVIVLGLAAVRWLLTAGFTPLWAAFTFPLAASAGLWDLVAGLHPSQLSDATAALLLAGATMIVVPIFLVIWRDWARGRLAVKTNAAIA